MSAVLVDTALATLRVDSIPCLDIIFLPCLPAIHVLLHSYTPCSRLYCWVQGLCSHYPKQASFLCKLPLSDTQLCNETDYDSCPCHRCVRLLHPQFHFHSCFTDVCHVTIQRQFKSLSKMLEVPPRPFINTVLVPFIVSEKGDSARKGQTPLLSVFGSY